MENMVDAKATGKSPRRTASGNGLTITVNGGSSSIKFSVCEPPKDGQAVPVKRLTGAIERIGEADTTLKAKDRDGAAIANKKIDAADHLKAADALSDWLKDQIGEEDVMGIGHRVVMGGFRLTEHQLITDAVVEELRNTQSLDLAHLPREIALIETFRTRFPSVAQVACFDTAFHRHLPRVAQLMPIPRRFDRAGIRRFGFHGLSYTYLMQELRRQAGDRVAEGRVILAHLGSGASMAAVLNGKSVDTTMGFTPTAGLVMGTRPGDLDPGLLVYLMRAEKLTPEELDEMINGQSGLLGVSETTSDAHELLQREASDERAKEALDLFCCQAKKWIGAYAAVLGGLDTLVFSGGIGEHSPVLRSRICNGLEFLGIDLDPARNNDSQGVISSPQSRASVRVIATDEEAIIAQTVYSLVSQP
jgi:acetate kinase